MRACESVVLHAGLSNATHGRKPRQVVFEQIRPGRLAHQTDIRNADRIALTIAAGFLASAEIAFERLQGGADPVMYPFETLGFAEPELMLKIFAHAWHHERM